MPRRKGKWRGKHGSTTEYCSLAVTCRTEGYQPNVLPYGSGDRPIDAEACERAQRALVALRISGSSSSLVSSSGERGGPPSTCHLERLLNPSIEPVGPVGPVDRDGEIRSKVEGSNLTVSVDFHHNQGFCEAKTPEYEQVDHSTRHARMKPTLLRTTKAHSSVLLLRDAGSGTAKPPTLGVIAT